ncbi:2-heptaprenyl-1,4-naphthoquinone methyltransferase [candidate division MSBL1 archaeon SCGC-AAA259E17]|uniref:2-heptaprenyl-1,4-naphthoquinone methyltransferase n=1 Tax=candidate division MSBL1 archaeon SCGC-AAA259E17 TaxID=1698263 RepID=A0A133UD26_9EURY|nr:2-heptaprenyl-1,4-naphthoquinone methyltransferase [candidate division MSBL1 archaeon SCGC-AAA259E17]
MLEESKSQSPTMLPVPRTKEEAKQFYDRISRLYDYLTGAFEQKYAEMALDRLPLEEGQTVLEIGFGTGHCLKQIAERIGQASKAYGIDISPGMLEVTKERLDKAGLTNRVKLYCGDAVSLPYDGDAFDAVFMSFTLELFDTPEVPKVLCEIKKVLKSGGKLGLVSMSKENGGSIMLRLYEWAHMKWPKYIDCRPIYVEQSLKDAGYKIKSSEKIKLLGLPGEIIVASNAE